MTTANVPFNKQQQLKSIINFLNEQGFSVLNSIAGGYEDPKKIVFKGSELGFTPDVIAETKGCHYIFSLEEYADELSTSETHKKWRLFDAYAKQKKGLHYLVVPDKNVKEFKNLIADWNLDSRILALEW